MVAAPVIDNITGEVLTAFAAPVELNTLGERILKDNSNSKVKSFVIDSSGQVISSDDISQILKLNLSSEKGNIKTFYNQLKNKKSGKGHFTLKNTNYIAAYAKCENQDMCIISYMPVNAYMSKINELKTGLSFVILVGILISAIVIIVLSFRTVKPITL